MQLVRFRHKGQRQLHEDGNAKGVPSQMVDKLRKLSSRVRNRGVAGATRPVSGLEAASMKGDLKGFWSLTVTGNWRLIFGYEEGTNTASDIDLIDYH